MHVYIYYMYNVYIYIYICKRIHAHTYYNIAHSRARLHLAVDVQAAPREEGVALAPRDELRLALLHVTTLLVCHVTSLSSRVVIPL